MSIKLKINGQEREINADADKDIHTYMSGNACRCATYVRIRAAIHHAADLLEA